MHPPPPARKAQLFNVFGAGRVHMELFDVIIEPSGPLIVSTYGPYSLGPSMAPLNAPVPISGTWPAVNMLRLAPITLPFSFLADAIVLYNGATVSGNFVAGVYSPEGRLLVTTPSTAQAVINTTQSVSIPLLKLLPGKTYWLAEARDNIVATTMRTSIAPTFLHTLLGHINLLSSFPLPANIRFGVLATDQPPIISLTGSPGA